MVARHSLQKPKRVLVNSSSMHGVGEAVGLAQAGYEVTLATSLCFSDLSWIPERLPFNALRNFLLTRYFPELVGVDLQRLVLPELVIRLQNILGLGSQSMRYNVHNVLFDWLTSRRVDDYDVFQFVNGTGLISAKRAKKAHKTVLLSQRAAHPVHATHVLKAEFELFGLDYKHPESAFFDRIYQEQELADYILVPSSYCADTFLAQGIPASKLKMVNLFYNDQRFVNDGIRSSDDSSVFRVLFVGTASIAKGVHYLLEAFAKAQLAQAELLLVGAIEPAIMNCLAKINVENIRHIPHVSQPSLPEIYRASSVLVLPSLTDSWGFVVLEAMACGLPVIISKHTGATDVVREGEDGFTVEVRDADSIAQALTALHGNRELCGQLGRNAQGRVKEFTRGKYAQRILQAYQEIFSVTD